MMFSCLVSTCLPIVLILITVPSIVVINAETDESIALKFRLPSNVLPVHYTIKINPHIIVDNFTFDGESHILIDVLQSTKNLTFHAYNMTLIHDVTSLHDVEANTTIKPSDQLLDDKRQFCILHFQEALNPGKYILHLKYTGLMNFKFIGFYRSFYTDDNGEKIWLGATHFEAHTARMAFPCWDEPALKATFDISIKHFPNYTAVSNMPILDKGIIEEDGKQWTHFKTTPIMSTYLIGYVVADYGNLTAQVGNTTIGFWSRKNAMKKIQYAFEVSKKVNAVMEEYTNITFDLPKLDHLAIPHFSSSAVENWGAITYLEYSVFYEENEPMETKEQVARIVCHETVHQWFGNLVSPSWWTYLWLNEGFASYLQHYCVEKVDTFERTIDKFVIQDVSYTAMEADSYEETIPLNVMITGDGDVRKPFYHSGITYRKGASVIHMLNGLLSEEIFRRGLYKYLSKNQYKSVTTDDLWEAMQEAYDEGNPLSNHIDIKKIMDTWTKQAGYPLVTVTRDNSTGSLLLTQNRYLQKLKDTIPTPDNRKWWVPITFATKSNLNFSSTIPSHWMDPENENLTIDGINKDDWIIVNIQSSGFYRVNYDKESWKRIIEYLNSENFEKIHVLNRARLLADALEFFENGLLDTEIFVDLVTYLHREKDYIPWIPGFRCLFKLNDILKELSSHPLVQKYFLHLINEVVKDVGFEYVENEDYFKTLSRRKVLNYAVKWGHVPCRQYFAELHVKNRKNPEEYPILPHMEHFIHCTGIAEGNETVWEEEFKLFKKDPIANAEIINYLACTKNITLAKKFLNVALEPSSIPKEVNGDILAVVMASETNNLDFVIDFLVKNKDAILQRMGLTKSEILHVLQAIFWDKIKTQDDLKQIKVLVDVYQDVLDEITFDELVSAAHVFLGKTDEPVENNEIFKYIQKHTSALNEIQSVQEN